MKIDYYEILGAERTATTTEIIQAYRKKARETHPDHNKGSVAFKAVAEAYRILKDPVLRAEYDRTGQAPSGYSNHVELKIANTLMDAIINHQDAVRGIKILLGEELGELDQLVSGLKRTRDLLDSQWKEYTKANPEATGESSVLLEMLLYHLREVDERIHQAETAQELIHSCFKYLENINSPPPLSSAEIVMRTFGGRNDRKASKDRNDRKDRKDPRGQWL